MSMAEPLHVYPVHDIYPHEVDGAPCPCKPSIEMRNGETIIVHHAWDMREVIEALAGDMLGICKLGASIAIRKRRYSRGL